MTIPTPFNLAILFDGSVRPEYKKFIVGELAQGNRTISCFDQADQSCEVIFVDGHVSAEAIEGIANKIRVAAVGLTSRFDEAGQSLSGAPYLLHVQSGFDRGSVLTEQVFVVGRAPVHA